MLTLWGRKTSVNVQKPMWLIGELGLAVDRKDVGGAFGGLDTPQYGAMNPHGLVPTLQDGALAMWSPKRCCVTWARSTVNISFRPSRPRAR
ncbi:MAG: glutathione S-transferase N-terminal domain-containing protein [Burkholderiaceae bacterium]